MMEVADDRVRLRESINFPLLQLWVCGDLLANEEELESGDVVLHLDMTPAELP
jgi:hypothetical protein